MTRRQAGTLLLKIILSGGLIWLLYRTTPFVDIRDVFATMDGRFLVPIAALLFINTVLSALKWKLLLLADNVHIALGTLVRTYLIGSFYNLFLPSNIGGDTYRVYDIARQSREVVRSATSVFADRFSGFLAMVMLALCSSVIVAWQVKNLAFFVGPLVLFILMLLLLATLWRQTPLRRMLALTRLDTIALVSKVTDKVFQSFERYGNHPGLLVRIMLMSFLFQLQVIVVIYLLAKSLHASVSFFYFSAFVPLITLMEALPISIYGIGVRDAGYVFFFGWAGLSEVQTRSLALAFLALTVAYSLVGGVLLLWKMWCAGRQKPSKDCCNG